MVINLINTSFLILSRYKKVKIALIAQKNNMHLLDHLVIKHKTIISQAVFHMGFRVTIVFIEILTAVDICNIQII